MPKYTKTYDECHFLNYNNCYDLSLYEVGSQQCPPDYSFGPIIRNHYVLHYIINGQGVLHLDQNTFSIHAGEIFVIPPNVLSYYQADNCHPWNYIWIHIDGPKASEYLNFAGLDKNTPIFHSENAGSQLKAIFDSLLLNSQRELFCIGKLYEMFEYLIEHSVTKPRQTLDAKLKYVKTIVDYIHLKYNESITCEDIARACGLERSYMTRLFKNSTGHTPSEYLIEYRMKEAKRLLKESDFSVKNIAYAIGYTDTFTFSKAFRRTVGLSPSQYRSKYLHS